MTPTTVASIEVPFTTEECKEKASRWDGITMEFWTKFWEELANPCLALLNIAFIEGNLEKSITKGFIKPIPK